MNRPGFDGGSDDTEGSLSWDRKSTPMSCAGEPRGWRWRRWLARLGPRARSVGSARSWVSTPRLCAPGSRRPRSTRAPSPAPPPTRHSGSRSWTKRSDSCEEPTRSQRAQSACLSRRSVSTRPVDLPVHRLPYEGGVWGLADLQGAHWRRSQDRPEHLTHARRSRPPSARAAR